VPAPAGECSKATEATPETASVAFAPSETVPRRYVPGSSMIASGPVLSTTRSSITADGLELLALSVATIRRS
jgi:hypothetical protein